MNLVQAVDEREKGSVPVSIGTALALESADGRYPDRPVVDPPPIAGVDLLLLNVRTLLRNLMGSVDRELKPRLDPKHVIAPLVEEMRIIDAFVNERTYGRGRCLHYLSDYQHLDPKRWVGALFRIPHTPKQLAEAGFEQAVLDLLVRRELDVPFTRFAGALEGKFPRSLIVTHHPVDLLERRLFAKLDLLESHTGAIKSYGLWGSKLNGQQLEHIPFNPFTLKVFGDGVQFASQRPTLKKAVLDVAALDRWSGLSSQALVEHSVAKIPDLKVRSELQSML